MSGAPTGNGGCVFFVKKFDNLRGFGIFLADMNMTLANEYAGQNPTGWVMSEKLDGVRAYWDGEKFLSRNGNLFHAPIWFTEQMPKVALDGELFIARGMFQKTVGIVRGKFGDWSKIKFCVFDAPHVSGDFMARLQCAQDAIQGSTVAQIVEHITCTSQAHLDAFVSDLQAKGAEGVMLRNPRMAYEQKRTDNLLKIKQVDTCEAVVIGHKTNAIVVKWNDLVFNLGSGLTNALRESLPSIGSVVTFAFSGMTDSGLPRFASFLAVRDYE